MSVDFNWKEVDVIIHRLKDGLSTISKIERQHNAVGVLLGTLKNEMFAELEKLYEIIGRQPDRQKE